MPSLVKNIIFLLFLSCFLSRNTMALEVSEAQLIALESSGELLAPEALVQRVDKDLKAIRSKFPAVAEVHTTGKWQPGRLLISNVKKESLDAINKSAYGPIESKAIFQDTIYSVVFQKPYNPQILSEILKKEFSLTSADPDGIIGGSSSITLNAGSSPTGKNTYVFMKGWGDCFAGCINKHFWTFAVGPDANSVELVEEKGSDLSTMNQEGGAPVVGLFG
ncbi:50S ribosomal protein L9 [Orchesella cincta]|uniref:50S ribosomal protein L9 n=1 Tax=Orchesella cincta TaxID=48709 RepID=A0A1D2N0E9_ORCCI|nr:50S ribosomal protein L9 [Orchesella cincta]